MTARGAARRVPAYDPRMRCLVITPDGLVPTERPTPAPGHEQLLVRVHATALNRADLMQIAGVYPAPPGWPADVPGLEYAGEVVAVGPGVRERAVGDRVFGLVGGGGLADHVVVHERTAVRVPDALSWTEAGAIPEVFMTAHDALVQAEARPGELVLVHAVASGVGLAAVQLARAFGMQVVGTVRDSADAARKLDAARALGLRDGVALGAETLGDAKRLAEALAALTGAPARGADVVLDLVGGAYVGATCAAMAARGRMILIGLVAGRRDTLDLGLILNRRLSLRGTVMRSRPLEERIATAARFAREGVPLLADGRVRATIDATYPLEEANAAYALLASNRTTGKIVLTVG